MNERFPRFEISKVAKITISHALQELGGDGDTYRIIDAFEDDGTVCMRLTANTSGGKSGIEIPNDYPNRGVIAGSNIEVSRPGDDDDGDDDDGDDCLGDETYDHVYMTVCPGCEQTGGTHVAHGQCWHQECYEQMEDEMNEQRRIDEISDLMTHQALKHEYAKDKEDSPEYKQKERMYLTIAKALAYVPASDKKLRAELGRIYFS